MEPNYVATFTLEKVIDGSTFVGLLDYGLDVLLRKKVRLVSIQCHAPEVPQGAEAKAFVERLIQGRELRVKTLRDRFRKWNTVLGVMYAKNGDGRWINVNDTMVEREMARPIKDGESV